MQPCQSIAHVQAAATRAVVVAEAQVAIDVAPSAQSSSDFRSHDDPGGIDEDAAGRLTPCASMGNVRMKYLIFRAVLQFNFPRCRSGYDRVHRYNPAVVKGFLGHFMKGQPLVRFVFLRFGLSGI